MITVYLAGIPNYYEGEDIEVRYRGFIDDKEVINKSLLKDYKKPALVNLFALINLLKDLESYKENSISIIVNDPALMELIKGTSTTRDRDVIKVAASVRDRLKEFQNLSVKNVSNDSTQLAKWNEILTM